MALYKEENGTWMFRTYITDDAGKRKQVKRRGFKTKAEAREAERLFIPAQEYEKKKETQNNIIYFEDKVDEFFFEEGKRIKISTLGNNKYYFNAHIKPFFEQKDIMSITSNDIQKWQNNMIKKNLSKNYINHTFRLLTNYFKYMVTFYLLPTNPCDRIQPLREKNDVIVENVSSKLKVCEKDDFEKYLSTFDDKDIAYKVAFEIMYKAGTRRSETRALKWKDVNFNEHTISINKQLQNTADGVLTTTTKSKTSNRTIFMSKSLEDSLKELYNKEFEKYDLKNLDDLYVLGGIDPVGATTLNVQREKHIKLAEIPYFTNHELRHSYGSNLINDGFDIKYVSEQMGHESISVTLSVYHHLLSDTKEQNRLKYYNNY